MLVPPPCDETMGFRLLEKRPDGTVWEWIPDERFQNPAGSIQGGLVGAFLDTVNGASLVRALRGRTVIPTTVEQKVSFLRAVRPGTRLTAEGRTVSVGERVAFVESRALDGEGRVVATSTSTWLLLEHR